MRTTSRPTRPRADLLAWLLLASMTGFAHAQDSTEVPPPTIGVIKLVAHPTPVASELPGRIDPHFLLAGLPSTDGSLQHAKPAQANAHQRLARHIRFGSRTSRHAATWHKPTRLWHWRKRRWKKRSQPPTHPGTRSDRKLHRSEVTFGLERRADASPFPADQHRLNRLPARSALSDGSPDGFGYSDRDMRIEIKNLIAEAGREHATTVMQKSTPLALSGRAAQLGNG